MAILFGVLAGIGWLTPSGAEQGGRVLRLVELTSLVGAGSAASRNGAARRGRFGDRCHARRARKRDCPGARRRLESDRDGHRHPPERPALAARRGAREAAPFTVAVMIANRKLA
jgi:hypothetical protein